MAIIVNGSALRTLGQPIYVDGKQVLEGYFDGVKCYPDEYPFKHVLTRKETKKLPGQSLFFDTVGPAATHEFRGKESDVTYECFFEEITESDIDFRLSPGNDERTYNYLKPNVMSGESIDAWQLKTTVKISFRYLGGMTVYGTGEFSVGGRTISSGPETARFFVGDLQSALTFTHTFEFYQSYTLVDTAKYDSYNSYYPYKEPVFNGPHSMSYGLYNTGTGPSIKVYERFEMKTDPSLSDDIKDYGGPVISLEGSTDRSLLYGLGGTFRINTFYNERIYKHRLYRDIIEWDNRLTFPTPTV